MVPALHDDPQHDRKAQRWDPSHYIMHLKKKFEGRESVRKRFAFHCGYYLKSETRIRSIAKGNREQLSKPCFHKKNTYPAYAAAKVQVRSVI